MVCSKCGSEKVSVQVFNEASEVHQHHSVVWWFFVGWWWIPTKWLFLAIPAAIFKVFGKGRRKTVYTTKTVFACQDCGNTWSSQSQ